MKKKLLTIALALVIIITGAIAAKIYLDNKREAEEDAAAEETVLDLKSDLLDFAKLRKKNPDIVAWLTVDGTVIDYPIVQSEDNEYYLTRDAKKQSNRNGALFLDYRSNADFSDYSSVIYGHHMASGLMFQNLAKYRNSGFFSENTTGKLYTPEKNFDLEIFAVTLTNARSDYYKYAFLSLAEEQAQLKMIKATSMHYRDPGAVDRMLVLSTCSFEYKEARVVLVCKIVDKTGVPA